MTQHKLSPLDARWLLMESKDTPMHAGALLTFQLPKSSPEDYLQDMMAQFRSDRSLVAPWCLRLKHPNSTSLSPQLEQVKNIDLDYHFRHSALPKPGGEKELGILVSRLHSHPLDKQRPLWELHLIEGLENNRFAMYVKVHPTMINGNDLAPILLKVLSNNPKEKNNGANWSHYLRDDALISSSDESPAAEFISKANQAGDSLFAAGRMATKMLRSSLNRSLKAPRLAPRSSLNSAVNNQRRFATQQYEYSRFEALAKAADCAPSTILAYLCGSALRRFFKEYNALPDKPLIAAGNLNLNDYIESEQKEVVAKVGISLATHIADPIKRLKAIIRSTSRTREHLSSLPDEARTPYAIITSLPMIAEQIKGIGRFIPNMFNVGISSVQASDDTLYFNGAKLEAMYPMAHLMQFSALSFDAVVYAGTINIGLTGARDTLPRLQRMALYMDQALSDLEALLLTQGADA